MVDDHPGRALGLPAMWMRGTMRTSNVRPARCSRTRDFLAQVSFDVIDHLLAVLDRRSHPPSRIRSPASRPACWAGVSATTALDRHPFRIGDFKSNRIRQNGRQEVGQHAAGQNGETHPLVGGCQPACHGGIVFPERADKRAEGDRSSG